MGDQLQEAIDEFSRLLEPRAAPPDQYLLLPDGEALVLLKAARKYRDLRAAALAYIGAVHHLQQAQFDREVVPGKASESAFEAASASLAHDEAHLAALLEAP